MPHDWKTWGMIRFIEMRESAFKNSSKLVFMIETSRIDISTNHQKTFHANIDSTQCYLSCLCGPSLSDLDQGLHETANGRVLLEEHNRHCVDSGPKWNLAFCLPNSHSRQAFCLCISVLVFTSMHFFKINFRHNLCMVGHFICLYHKQERRSVHKVRHWHDL